jgi:hypothetical protein
MSHSAGGLRGPLGPRGSGDAARPLATYYEVVAQYRVSCGGAQASPLWGRIATVGASRCTGHAECYALATSCFRRCRPPHWVHCVADSSTSHRMHCVAEFGTSRSALPPPGTGPVASVLLPQLSFPEDVACYLGSQQRPSAQRQVMKGMVRFRCAAVA